MKVYPTVLGQSLPLKNLICTCVHMHTHTHTFCGNEGEFSEISLPVYNSWIYFISRGMGFLPALDIVVQSNGNIMMNKQKSTFQ